MRRHLAIPALVLCALLAGALPVSAATEFPLGYEGYHTYSEIDQFLADTVATYGQGTGAIVRRSVIGKSYEGRDIWVLKISDNVGTDEREPEVLAECNMHAREHLTAEMCVYMIRLLTENYGQTTALGQRVTNIVRSREIWIVPTLNPDGADYNIANGAFKKWRKNRQDNPGSPYDGIDLNRNWSYMWNSGGSSGNPKSQGYRGRYPFEAVEDRVLRDFILGRRVGGVQQITSVFNWHSYGEFVMWPYGYTTVDVPPTMTQADHDTFVALARTMASMNGYKAHQGSDSYIYSGDFPAWAYGDQRMFVFTIEMYPPWGCNGCGGFHPPDEVIERETTRNREPVLYLLEQADCPYRAAGLQQTFCGPFRDDFETDRGWTLSGGGAGSGMWARAIPALTETGAGVKQLGAVTSGQADLVTGAAAGADATANDVDGSTAARSRLFKLGAGAWTVSFKYTFAHDAAATAADYLRLSILSGTTETPVWTVSGDTVERNADWTPVSVNLDAFAGKQVRLRFQAVDGDADNLVEAAIDDVQVYRTP